MKLIFLDFDGVLNCESWLRRRESREQEFHPPSIEALNAIIAATGAKVVISSSWRLMHTFPYLLELLKREGVQADVIGKTPNLWNSTSRGGAIVMAEPRGHEIHAWIKGTGVATSGVVILDDDADMACMSPWHIKTEFEEGLGLSHVPRAITLLNQPFALPDMTP